MNRETPELDHRGLFKCRDCHRGTLFGLILYFFIGCKVNTPSIYLQQYSWEVLLRV